MWWPPLRRGEVGVGAVGCERVRPGRSFWCMHGLQYQQLLVIFVFLWFFCKKITYSGVKKDREGFGTMQNALLHSVKKMPRDERCMRCKYILYSSVAIMYDRRVYV
jgi:hypothetical protein